MTDRVTHAPDPRLACTYAMWRVVSGHRLVIEARGLRSDDGENPEYDRALVELVTRVLGLGHDEHGPIMEELILR